MTRLSLFKLLIPFLFIFSISHAQESNLIEVSGTVTGQDTKEPLANVSVNIKGTVSGTITNTAGRFSLRTRLKFPFVLVFSSVGFEQQEYTITGTDSKVNIQLPTQTVLGKEVVVTASRV